MGIITNAGLAYISRQQANNQPVQMSHFVVAYIPDLDVMSTPDPDDGLPDQSLITGQFPIAREGYNNQDSITYTLELDSSVGNFDFNWYAIITDSNEVAAINFIYPVFKRAGIQQIVTRNFVMNYARAQEATGITIPAQTWQFDYTAQMTNVENSIAAVNIDLQQTKDNINNRLLEHSNQLIDHSQQLQTHAQQLQSHGQLHNNHGQRLNGHDTTLGQHNTTINTNRDNINGHTALIEEHTRQINGQADLLTNHESRIQQNANNSTAITNRLNAMRSNGPAPVSIHSFNTIVRFRGENRISVFRLAMSITAQSYRFGGIFDIVCSVASGLIVVPVVNTQYGEITMRAVYDNAGNGTIAIQIQQTARGAISTSFVCVPYSGTAEVYTGAMDTAEHQFEMTYR